MNFEKILNNTVEDKNGCWNWVKSTSGSGYGQIKENKVFWSAHRYSYVCIYGKIPSHLILRHLCHNRLCCNPNHLQVGSHEDNWKDSEEIHRESHRKQSHKWMISNQVFESAREAMKGTGICMNTIIKYSKNGVFDIDSYRESCKIAGWTPKI